MGREIKGHLNHCGRVISPEELADIRETVATCSRLSRSELARTIGEHLEWYSASGSLKLDACLKLLEKLEAQEGLKIPEIQISSGWSGKQVPQTKNTEAGELLEGSVGTLGPFQVVPVTEKEEIGLWNEYVNRYHYLGYKQPFGCSVRYFITNLHGKLGCLLFSGAAKGLRERDKWLGWSTDERLKNLGLVINNNRFLIFPWVKIKYLASHVLGQAARRVCDDWQQRWGYRPVVVETFVDPERYSGTCYRAANWIYVGDTTGTGLARHGKSYASSPKKIFVLPLVPDFRTVLCSDKELQP
jgi:hypothetical protein